MKKEKPLSENALAILFFIVVALAWLTNLIVCIREESWTLLIIGTFIFPIGVLNGIGIWLGLT